MASTTRRRQAVIRRRRLTAAGALIATAAGGTVLVTAPSGSPMSLGRTTAPAAPKVLQVEVGDRVLARIRRDRIVRAGRVDRALVTQVVEGTLPAEAMASRGRAAVRYRYRPAATVDRVMAADGQGVVQASREAVAASVPAPVFKQALRNNCESAALSILLATQGEQVSQQRLQAAFPTSGPLDPDDSGAARVWGDPDRGYVGRPDGGGVAGGFGVYPGPVEQTAARFGAQLTDLTGRQPSSVYDALLNGQAVMAWIGLSDGPYGSWRSPAGRSIDVNFGEHTVVLHGIREDGSLLVSNPLEGTREEWTKGQFQELWSRLGRRALATT